MGLQCGPKGGNFRDVAAALPIPQGTIKAPDVVIGGLLGKLVFQDRVCRFVQTIHTAPGRIEPPNVELPNCPKHIGGKLNAPIRKGDARGTLDLGTAITTPAPILPISLAEEERQSTQVVDDLDAMIVARHRRNGCQTADQ